MKTSKKTKSKPKVKSIAVLCSGGDAPGMNAAVRAVVRSGITLGLDVYGIYKGYSGLLEGNIEKLSLRSVANIIQRGGTILKTDRCKAFFQKSARAEAANLLRRKKIDALVVVGGDGSFTGAHLMESETGFPVVGVPGTIDNDIYGSEYTVGFDTAVNTALDAIDKIRDTASSHDRVFFVEVMGRTSSEIALRVGVSGGAECIIVPESPGEKSLQELITTLKRSQDHGKMSSIVVVAEGAEWGAYDLAKNLKAKTGIESRVVILGHIQRGGIPSAMDRYMVSVMRVEAVRAAMEQDSGKTIGVVNGKIARISFTKLIGKHKKTDLDLMDVARLLAN